MNGAYAHGEPRKYLETLACVTAEAAAQQDRPGLREPDGELQRLVETRARIDPAGAMAIMGFVGVAARGGVRERVKARQGWVRAFQLDRSALARSAMASKMERHSEDAADCQCSGVDLLRAVTHVWNDDAAGALAHAMREGRSEHPQSVYVAGVICRSAYWLLGDLHALATTGRAVPPCAAGPQIALASLMDRALDAAIELQQLRLPTARRISRCVVDIASGPGMPPAASLLPLLVLAEIAYEEGDLDEADGSVRAILPRVRAVGSTETAVRAYTILARSAFGKGKCDFGLSVLREGEALGRQRNWPRLSAACLAARVGILTTGGSIGEATAALDRLLALRQPGRGIDQSVCFHIDVARSRMAGAGAETGNEISLLRTLMTEVLARGELMRGVTLAVRLVGALARTEQFDTAGAMLSQLLAIGCDAGLFRTILDGDVEVRAVLQTLLTKLPAPHLNSFAALLLEHWPEPFDTKGLGCVKRSGGMLTPREHNVLQLMSFGDSNKRIAQRLGIAPETVKSHVKNIFMRLGSSTRAEAVSRAASLGMV